MNKMKRKEKPHKQILSQFLAQQVIIMIVKFKK